MNQMEINGYEDPSINVELSLLENLTNEQKFDIRSHKFTEWTYSIKYSVNLLKGYEVITEV